MASQVGSLRAFFQLAQFADWTRHCLVAGAIFVFSLFFAPRRGLVSSVECVLPEPTIAEDHTWNTSLSMRAFPDGLSVCFRFVVGRPKINRLMRRLSQHLSNVFHLVVDAKGRSRGLTIQRNHRLWTQYLISHADIAANHVDWSVTGRHVV